MDTVDLPSAAAYHARVSRIQDSLEASERGESMSPIDRQSPLVRRSFLSRLGVSLAAVGAWRAGAGTAQAQSAGNGPWQPNHHAEDDWLAQLPGKHRLLFDTTTPEGFGSALLFASNYYTANQSGYGLKDADLAVVIVVRHHSTPFGYNDAMWAKYGAVLAERPGFKDPQTKQPPTINVYNSSARGESLPNNGRTLDSLLKRGLQLAVCQMATRRLAGAIAGKTGGSADAVYNELVGSLVGNAHMVPAGIVTVNRAQERGYSFAPAV
jgi:intracellular sulfur oxidation DsrE/DsrF family protein